MGKKNRGQQPQPKKPVPQQPKSESRADIHDLPDPAMPPDAPDKHTEDLLIEADEVSGYTKEEVADLKKAWGNYGPINKERWEKAQIAERGYHNLSFAEGLMHYNQSYRKYFEHVGLGTDLGGMTVIEVGPADFPALYFCENFNGVIVEPMESEHLRRICQSKNIQLIQKTLEELDGTEVIALQVVQNAVTEVWLFNVMQHIANPEVFVQKCKMLADRIRFFEPIDQPVELHHPQSYSLQDFKTWFGDCVQLYPGGSSPNFHTAPCAYGVWICPNE